MRKTGLSILVFLLFFAFLGAMSMHAHEAHAAIKDWQKGISLYPEANNDFAKKTFQESLTNAKDIGANTATFIIPYYQTGHNTTDIQPGWNTPTDSSLTAGINYAHSLGMAVSLKIHLNSYYGDSWAAFINPTSQKKRAEWFINYQKLLNHYAMLAQTNKVEQLCIGNELTSMTSEMVNTENTSSWRSIITNVRSEFSGSLTYNANADEKDSIGFWPDLDYIGVSAYFSLSDDKNTSWTHWNSHDILPLEQKFHKPVLFTEIGYRSVKNAHTTPWNYEAGTAIDQREQADDYNALFTYWNNFDYMQGINIWNWETNPNAGGPNDTTYTIQNKLAQSVVNQWFKN